MSNREKDKRDFHDGSLLDCRLKQKTKSKLQEMHGSQVLLEKLQHFLKDQVPFWVPVGESQSVAAQVADSGSFDV